MSVKKFLEEMGYEDIIIFDDYGIDTLIGVTTDNRAVYDYDEMINQLVYEGYTDSDAIDYIESNTIRSLGYMGDKAPIVIHNFCLTI